MTRFLISTALAALLTASGSALAQDHHDHGGGGHPGGGHAGPPAHEMHGPGPAMHHEDHRGGPPAAARAAGGRPDDHRPDGPRPGGFRDNNRGSAPHFAPGGNGHRDFSAFHRNFNASRHFHAPVYRRPSGWYDHRWSYGEILPRLFWAPDYWINDFDDFGLEPPPPGAVWVRDGDDALLIDRYSGEIIQVDYGVFY